MCTVFEEIRAEGKTEALKMEQEELFVWVKNLVFQMIIF